MTNIDTIREALERLKGFTYHAAGSQDSDDIKTLIAALSTIGPDAQRNIKELRDLLDLQHTSTMEADKLWQKANGKDRLPDLGELIEWLMKRSDPDAVRRECAEIVRQWASVGTLMNDNVELLCAAILGTEPAQEESR